jgi:hypothetical protein
VQVSNLKVGKLIDFGDDEATTPSSLVFPRGPAARGRHSASHRGIARHSDDVIVARSEQWKKQGSHWPAMAAQEEIEKSHDSVRDQLRKKPSEIQIVSKVSINPFLPC